MSKTQVVIFSDNGAKILVNPTDVDSYKDRSDTVINPNLEAVRGLPPHRWALEGGEVVPRTDKPAQSEKPVEPPPAPRRRRFRIPYKLRPLIHALIGAAIALAIRALS